MKVIIDDKIPYIKGWIEQFPYRESIVVKYLPGAQITRKEVADADALIIRTRTHCNADLLEGSRVRFIATATIGFDHIDTEYCQKKQIRWTNAPGCNADSVAQYIESVLYLLEKRTGRAFCDTTLGIVGVGHVGKKVEEMAGKLGVSVLRCDPPRADAEGEEGFCSLNELAEQCDILTFHTPLIREGIHPTYHLADHTLFSQMKKGACLINTSRGEVVDNKVLLQALCEGVLSEAILDVWENEPEPLPELLEKAFIATPHIAGYSADGKANATRMSLDSFCRFFQIQGNYRIEPPAPAQSILHTTTLSEAILAIYDPRQDSEALKNHPEQFEQLRGNYPLRREKGAYRFEFSRK